MDHRVEFLMDYIKREVRPRLSTNAMAGMVNLSSSRLAHLFRLEARVSMRHFRREVQMQHAKVLLETTFLSVKQVMASSGFRDASHFVRDFRRHFGKTPSQYRREYKARGLANK